MNSNQDVKVFLLIIPFQYICILLNPLMFNNLSFGGKKIFFF